MIRQLIILAFLAFVLWSYPRSEKTVAVVDKLEISLKEREIKEWTHRPTQHTDQAFMVNVDVQELAAPFPELQIVVVNEDKSKNTCHFKYATNICVLQKSTQYINVKVECLAPSCQVDLIFSQRVLYTLQDSSLHKSKALTMPGEIYKVEKQQYNSILEIYSELKEQFLLPKEIQVYSNVHVFRLSQVLELDASSTVYGFKPILTDNDRYFYIEDTVEDNRQLRFNYKTHGGMIKEAVPVVDFIETYGHRFLNSYNYDGTFSHHIQAYARVFSPSYGTSLPFSIVVKGKQSPSDNATTISALHLPEVPFKNHKFYDISFTVTKTRHSAFKIISFELLIDKVENKTIFVEFEVFDRTNSEVHIFDHVFFSSAKEEELHFSVTEQVKYQIQGADQDVQIITNASQKYLTSQATCSLHKGCDIEVKTQDQCEACSFKMDLQGADIMNHVIYYKVSDNVIEAKIDFEEELFFKKNMEPKKYYQIVTNTPNVMIYANFQGYKRCKVPSPSCHQYAINQQTPQLIANTEEKDQALVIMVIGLQMTQFKVRFIENTKGLQLTLGEKFSYLFDDEQKEITLTFTTNRETFSSQSNHLNFNLISPTNSLQLTVANEDGLTYTAVDGYVQFDKKDLLSDKFTINIRKLGVFLNQYVHMTLIVSTSDTVIPLDSTTTHYEKYYPLQEKKYLVQFDPSEETSLNIFTENLQKYQGKMELVIFDLNLEQAEEEERKPIIRKELVRDNEMIDLDLELQALDLCSQVNCELEIRIKSEVKYEIEQMITILHEQSVIMLDDSIWSSFEVNDLSKSNHFYYVPRQTNKTINILFITEDKDIFIDYSIYNTKKSINPQNWPWDHHDPYDKLDIFKHLNGHQEFQIKPDHPDIQKCWPTCVVLITVGDARRGEVADASKELIKTYKILASSTVIQMPEDTRFQIIMEPEEENTMFIQLANFIDSKTEEFTFFTEYKMGRAKVTATLVSKGQEYKLGESNSDFVLEDVETHLPVTTVQNVMESFHLNPEQTSLQLNFKALSTVKMYLQFTSFMRNFYRLNMDDLEVVNLKEGEQVWYQYIPERDYSIKFYRGRGFPLFKIVECQEQSFLDCLDKHKKLLELQVAQKHKIEERTKNSSKPEAKDIEVNQELQQTTAKELQLFTDKNYQYSSEMCQRCIVFIWVYSYAQDLQMSINIRSSSTETELKELVVVNDRIQKQEYHLKYLLNVQPEKLAMVTFRIIEGLCSVQIEDSDSLLFNETFSSIDKDYKDIRIDPIALPDRQQAPDYKDDEGDEPNIPPVFKKPTKNKHESILRHLHLKVTSMSEQPIEYLLSYSVGNSGVYIEDGILSQKNMIPGIPHTFYYHNVDKQTHAFLTLSSTPIEGYGKEVSKNQYEVRFYYYPDANQRQIKEEFKPEMPPKKNANYFGKTISHVYELPTKFQLFQVQIFTSNYLKIIASINHKDLVYLPIGFEYLIKLQKKESIYFVVDRPDSDYLQMSIKKCDTSIPTLYYTNDAKEFKEGMYETEEEIENGFEKKLIKTKNSSKTIHAKFTAEEEIGSVFKVGVVPSTDPKKSQSHKFKAGNSGILSYNFLDTNKVEIEFSPAICDGKICPDSTQYYLMIGQTIDSIYGELNCAGTYMISSNQKSKENQIFEVTSKYFNKQFNLYRMTIQIKHKQAFVGVKAIAHASDGRKVDVMYTPAQIEDLWSQASKMSLSIFLVFSLGLSLIISVVIIISTKLARRGYRPISAQE